MNLEAQLKALIREVADFPKPGILFKDITPLLAAPNLYKPIVTALAEPFRSMSIDYVAGMESRGFLYGMGLADTLNAGFIPVRKQGKLPRAAHSADYELEYGTASLEIHKEDVPAGSRVLIHDDLMATGGTAAATRNLFEKAHCQVVAYSFLITLDFLKGKDKLPGSHLHALVHY